MGEQPTFESMTTAPAPPAPLSAWAPLRIRIYRVLWIAQLASNVGTWMQMVGAQWLMGTLSGSTLLVALIQTAVTLPIFLVGFPAGALGDIFDRRRLLLAAQTFMVVSSGLLAALTLAGETTPGLLLGLTFTLGLGQALMAPSWQAIQPQLVGRELIPQAAALNATSMNLARAVGPAIGGALVAAAGPEWVFGLNAVSFIGVLAALAFWRREPRANVFGAEHVRSALRAGLRFVRSSPRMRTVLIRAFAFVMFATAIWALLPVVARSELGLGSDGYGLLLGAVGVGAVVAAATLPRIRERWSLDRLVTAASLAFAGSALVVGWVEFVPLVILALLVTGYCWIAVLSSLNASAQTVLPDWVRSRGMGIYLLVFQGGQAIGAVLWGVIASEGSTDLALTLVAAGLAAGMLVAPRWPLVTTPIDVRPREHWAEPELAIEPGPTDGPVLVTVEYCVPEDRAGAFRKAMERVGRSRRRSGAERWGLFQDGAEPKVFLEAYVVPTWQEHLRQHQERFTRSDQLYLERAREMVEDGTRPRVRHLFFAYPGDG
jgi:MFS family permease